MPDDDDNKLKYVQEFARGTPPDREQRLAERNERIVARKAAAASIREAAGDITHENPLKWVAMRSAAERLDPDPANLENKRRDQRDETRAVTKTKLGERPNPDPRDSHFQSPAEIRAALRPVGETFGSHHRPGGRGRSRGR